MRIIRNLMIGVAGLIILVVVAGLILSQTDWFRNYVREKIITSTEDSVGGRVEVGSFRFDARHFQADMADFFIHVNEPRGTPPFVHVARVQVNIRLFTSIHHLLDLTYLGVERPEVNVIVLSDGRTNIPTPRNKTVSKQTPLETVVDLAVGRFELNNGLLAVASQKQNLTFRGQNLRALLTYNILNQGYQGQLSFEPLYVLSGQNTPVNFRVTLPVALQRDRIDLHQGRITTAESDLLIDGSIENLQAPKISAHLNGHVALSDLRNAGNLSLATDLRNLPSTVELDANATVANNSIQVTALKLGIGHSTIEASGPLKAQNGAGALDFKARLALRELGRLAKIDGLPNDTVSLDGNARLDASNNYRVEANIGNFNLRALAQSLGQKQLPYDGVLSGIIEASGNLNTPAAKSVKATAKLSIAPGTRGIPVSGRLNAAYEGPTGDIAVGESYIALPHSRLTLNGSVGKQLNVALTSTNLNDLLAATAMASHPSLVLNGGQASFTGQVTGNLASPRITGHLAMNRFNIEGRAFDQFSTDAEASNRGAVIRNASLNRGAMQVQASGSVGLSAWKPLPSEPVTANASIRNGDVADLMALAGQSSSGYSGMLSANLGITGTVGNPQGAATLTATSGVIEGQPFDRMQAQVNLSDRLVTVSNTFLESGTERINLTARFEHPRNSITTGHLDTHVDSNQIDLAQFRPLQKERPNAAGMLQLNANLSATLSETKAGGKQETEFLLTSINADASARGLRSEGQDYGDLTLSARTSGQTVRYNLTSNLAGSNIRVTGDTRLTRDYPTTADANLNNLPIQRVLILAHRTDIPARGNLSGTAHFTGTAANPQGNVDLDLANAILYDEPVDHVRARVTYQAQTVDVPQFELVAGPSRIDLNARYDHPAGNFQAGHLDFHVNSSRIDLARIKNLQERRPGLIGSLQLAANGATDIRAGLAPIIRDLNASVKATGLAAQGKKLGDLSLTANSAGGRVNFALDSNLANASIHGQGNAQLATNYPIDAQVTFSNVKWTELQPLVSSNAGEPPTFDALAEGQVTVRGPAMKTDELAGSLQVTRLEVTSISRTPRTANTVLLANQGPISATLDHGLVRVTSAHVTGPQTDFQATGTVPLHNQAMNVALKGNLNLAILQRFDQDITSSGSLALSSTVQGTITSPLMNGRVELHNGSFNYATIPNGISNANGVILFNGNSASITNLTGESGGGKVTFGGFASMNGEVRFGLKATASNVRVLINQGASIAADATVNLTGTPQASLISGNVTIDRITYAPQTDIGSLLAAAAPPVQVAAAPSPLMDNMKLDIRVKSSDALAVQAAIAENLQAALDLRVRGTVSRPGVLGRITINQGKLVFFGSTYTVNSGTIGFYNPFRIAPVLDMNLETVAKGVDVTLQVTGPIDNMKLSYTSDPPLQFQEIVSLLAAGKTPTSDPTLLAHQPSTPPQSFEQMGESALVSQALVDPLANRLQRVFGVSQLKIDPTFTSGSQLPQAQLTLQQRVADNITFTYVTALNNSNAQTIEVEVSLNPQWSALATRDYNGIFSINLLYKKQFR